MLRNTVFACLTMLAVPAAVAQLQTSDAPPAAKGWRSVTVAAGISHPWGMAWLPYSLLVSKMSAPTLQG